MPKKPQKTAVATHTTTNTKILVALVALAIAGGLAFAAAPASKKSLSKKSALVEAKCGVNSLNYQKRNKKGAYLYASATCYNGEKVDLKGSGKYYNTVKGWSFLAKKACKNKCEEVTKDKNKNKNGEENIYSIDSEGCIDHDANEEFPDGKNYNTPSYAEDTARGQSQTDFCVLDEEGHFSHLLEGICNENGEVRGFPYACPFGCETRGSGNAFCSEPPEITCEDSDVENDPFVRGVLDYRMNGDLFPAGDHCDDNGQLIQVSCNGDFNENRFGWEASNCEFGCFDGVCLEEEVEPVVLMVSTSTLANNNEPAVAGTSEVELGFFSFNTDSDTPIQIKEIRFTQKEQDDNLASFNDYQILKLYNGNQLVGTAFPTDPTPVIYLTAGDRSLSTVDDQGIELSLKADLNYIGLQHPVAVGGHKLGFEIASPDDIRAERQDNGEVAEIHLTASPIEGSTRYMYKAIPNFEIVPIYDLLHNGSNDLLKFRVSAIGGDISLKKLSFYLRLSGVEVSGFELYDITDNQDELVFLSNQIIDRWGALQVIIGEGLNFPLEEQMVSEFRDRTFVLRTNVIGANSGDSISTGLNMDNRSQSYGGFAMGTVNDVQNSNFRNIIWSDHHAPGHSITTRDWTNGYMLIPNELVRGTNISL